MVAGLRKRVAAARSVCVLTGSGISAESGLPTFRGTGGLWRTHRVEELASMEGFERDPITVWTWYEERRRAHLAAQPSAGHRALAALERCAPDFTLVTQNVDSLHLRAGSRNVVELHGSLRTARCTGCGERRDLAQGMRPDAIVHTCGGRFRPDIVWFGEALPDAAWDVAVQAARRAEVLLVVGTSAIVQPAASLATRYARGAFVAEINPEPTALSPHVDLALRATASAILPALVEG